MKTQVILKEGRPLPRNADLSMETLRPLDSFTLETQLKKLPRIKKKYSQINQARRRYVLGDDDALNET